MHLHVHLLRLLNEPAFLFDDVLPRIQLLSRPNQSSRLLHAPRRNGVALVIAEMAFNDFFVQIEKDLRWNIGEPFTLLDCLLSSWQCNTSARRRGRFRDLEWRSFEVVDRFRKSAKIPDWQEESNAFVALETHVRDFARYCRRTPLYGRLRDCYSSELADRILHDRALSAQIAHFLTWIAPVNGYGHPTKFIKRCKWPTWVPNIIRSRDRGCCGRCSIDITRELLAVGHIDHIIPLAGGGCNDVVNLQLLCAKCNGDKGTYIDLVSSSVPQYHGFGTASRASVQYGTMFDGFDTVARWLGYPIDDDC